MRFEEDFLCSDGGHLFDIGAQSREDNVAGLFG